MFLSFDYLREHQQHDTNTLRDAIREILPEPIKRILFEASVGYGKAVIIQFLTGAYSQAGKRVLILSNRSAVTEQLDSRAGQMPGVKVMTVQAADSREKRKQEISKFKPHLILIDEVHMGGAATQYGRVMDAAPDALCIGFTGTPRAKTFEVFPVHVKGKSARWLTEKGYLAPLRYIAPNPFDVKGVKIKGGDYDEQSLIEALERQKIYSNAIKSYRTYAAGGPCLAFCVNVKHAEETATQFRESGIPCEVLTGKDNEKETERKVKFLKDGGLLFSVDKVSAGFDLPDLPVILILRATKSVQMWIQILGRVARAADGKTHGLVIDHVGNTLQLGTLTQDRDWRDEEQKPDPAQVTEDGEILTIRTCENCMSVFEAGPKECPACGVSLAKDTRISKAENARLIELDKEALRKIEERQKAVRKKMGGGYKQKKGFQVHKLGKTWQEAHHIAIKQLERKLEDACRFGDVELEAAVREELEVAGAE